MRWVTLPLTRPTLIATWTLLFILALAYVASGPILRARGERIQKLPFLHPLEPAATTASNADAAHAQAHDSDGTD